MHVAIYAQMTIMGEDNVVSTYYAYDRCRSKKSALIIIIKNYLSTFALQQKRLVVRPVSCLNVEKRR